MPINKKEVFKAIFKSKERKPLKEKKEKPLNRKKYVKSNGRYFAPDNKKTNEKIKNIKKELKQENKAKLLRFFDDDAISKSSPLDSRLGTYYEFDNGFIMSILTTEGTEVSSLTLNFEIFSEDLKQEKISGLYYFMIQLLLSEKFIQIEEKWDPLKLFSFREYIQEIGGKINLQYLPSCIMLSISCSSKYYIKSLEYFFDTIYLRSKGLKRKMKFTKSTIEEALINMNINYAETIYDETYLRFEILRDFLKKNRKSVYKSKNSKNVDILNMWSFTSEETILLLIKDGNLEFEIMNAYNRIILNRTAILVLHSNLTHLKLFSILNDYNIPLFNEKKQINNKISDILKKKNGFFMKNKIDNNDNLLIEMPSVTLPDIKPTIIMNSPIKNTKLTNGEIELQWIIPSFFSSLSSSNSKPLKIISYFFEFGPLLNFLKKRKLIDSINSGEMYFAAHSSQKIGFTIFSVILKLSKDIRYNINPKSSIIQFIVESIFTYIYSLISQIEKTIENLNIKSIEKENENINLNNNLILFIEDIMKIENYISNSNYQMNSEKENYFEYFDRNFEITETVLQNIKSHNPSEILIGNNRFYSNIKVILKYVKYTLEKAFKSTNFILYITSLNYFQENQRKKFFELEIKFSNSSKLYYDELKFENIFLDLLKDPLTLKKYLIKMDPIKEIIIKNNLLKEYDFILIPHYLLKNSKLTFINGNYEWNTYLNLSEIKDENPLKNTIPFISNPILISEDYQGRLSIYYSQIMYPNNTESIYQSSISSAIIRWYENFDYSKILNLNNNTFNNNFDNNNFDNNNNNNNMNVNNNNISNKSFLLSFLSKLLFTIWVTTILTENFISYKKLGATITFQPCNFFGTNLLTNCLQLQVTSPSPMFPNYLNEILNSIKSISLFNITEEIAEKLKKDAIKETEYYISSNTLTNICTDKIKNILLPEIIDPNEILNELKIITNKEIMILIDKKLTIQNPYINIIGLITHIENIEIGIKIIKESFISNICYKEFNLISNIFDNENLNLINYNHLILNKINNSKIRLIYSIYNNNLNENKINDNNTATSIWISIPNNNLYNRAILILIVQILHYTFKNIYIPKTFLINKDLKKNINLLVIPSPFLNNLGLLFALEVNNKNIFSSEDITTSSILLDFFSFIQDSQIFNQDIIEDQSKNKSNSLNLSFSLVYKQIRTEVILQLLLSQTQIVSQSSFLFGRIAQIFELNQHLDSKKIEEITNEKRLLNNIIEQIDLNSTIIFIKNLLENSTMILVESNIYKNNTLYDFHNQLINKYGFKNWN